jgi:hypothetical protein
MTLPRDRKECGQGDGLPPTNPDGLPVQFKAGGTEKLKPQLRHGNFLIGTIGITKISFLQIFINHAHGDV